jgi:hypothetical protein
MRHIHHGHIKTDIRHPLGEMISDLLFLKGGARDAQKRLFDLENARGIDVLLHGGQSSGHKVSPERFVAGALRRSG